jgi:hypothetical protein
MIAVAVFVAAAVIPAIPLIVLVTRADKIRAMIELLGRARDHGFISQKEFNRRAHELLNRTLWHL